VRKEARMEFRIEDAGAGGMKGKKEIPNVADAWHVTSNNMLQNITPSGHSALHGFTEAFAMPVKSMHTFPGMVE
jgi:hypothetical protein